MKSHLWWSSRICERWVLEITSSTQPSLLRIPKILILLAVGNVGHRGEHHEGFARICSFWDHFCLHQVYHGIHHHLGNMLGCSPSQSAPGLLHFLQGTPRNPHLPLLVGGSDPKKYIFLALQPWKSWPKGKDRWYSWPTGKVPDHDTKFLPDLESEKGTFPLFVVRLV